MGDWVLLADELRDFEGIGAAYRMTTTREYSARPLLFSRDAPKIINLSRSYNYQSAGYYASLLAEARGHRVIPSVETILDLSNRQAYERAIPELAEALNDDLRKEVEMPPEECLVFFGRTATGQLKNFSKLLFDWFRAPVLRVNFKTEQTSTTPWTLIKKISLTPITRLGENEVQTFAEALERYTNRAWRSPKQKVPAKYSIAVLYDPKEALPPSDISTLKHWAKLAEKQGVEVEPIQKKDLQRLAEFDALFIRETTSIRDHTYRFAQRARAEGMPVIDDPVSMIRCTNKIYLWERLRNAGMATPETVVLREGAPLVEAAEKLGFPLVIKVPDGSFSRGVRKAHTMDEFKTITDAWFEDTDFLLAQKYLPTDYDWRIGVLGGEGLFACQYGMASGHWQIIQHKEDGSARAGQVKAFKLEDVPSDVLDLGVRAARLIGEGLYGVDIKETPQGPVVIEINDNPNLDHGYEDIEEKSDLWLRLTRWFIERIDR